MPAGKMTKAIIMQRIEKLDNLDQRKDPIRNFPLLVSLSMIIATSDVPHQITSEKISSFASRSADQYTWSPPSCFSFSILGRMDYTLYLSFSISGCMYLQRHSENSLVKLRFKISPSMHRSQITQQQQVTPHFDAGAFETKNLYKRQSGHGSRNVGITAHSSTRM